MKLTIDPEFRDLLPPLSEEEKSAMEASIIKEGVRERLITWNSIIVDGHNRYDICTRNNIPFKTTAMEFTDRDSVMDWIDANQLGRRNLKPNDFKLAIGRRYERSKKPVSNQGGKNQHTEEVSGQNVHQPSTAEKLAQQHGVDARTVRRAGAFVNALAVLGLEEDAKKGKLNRMDKKVIDTAKKAIPELAEMLRVGEIDFKTCSAVAKLPKEEQKKATLGGVFGVKQAAKGKPKQDVVTPDQKKERVPDYIPQIGKEIAALARRTMDRVLDEDEHFEWAMDNMIAYCEKRKQNKK